jgi:hypothetical protein
MLYSCPDNGCAIYHFFKVPGPSVEIQPSLAAVEQVRGKAVFEGRMPVQRLTPGSPRLCGEDSKAGMLAFFQLLVQSALRTRAG